LSSKNIDFLKKNIVILRGVVSYGFWEPVQIQPPERIRLELPVRTEGMDLSPGIDYPVEKNCSGRRKPGTALLACNDISAISSIGSIRAYHEPSFRMPNASISYG
jgi:hypothetical protein